GPAWTGAGDGASGPGRRPDRAGSGELCSERSPVSRRFSGSTVSLAAQRWLSLSHPPAINYTSDSRRNRKCFRWGVGQFISAVYGSVYRFFRTLGAIWTQGAGFFWKVANPCTTLKTGVSWHVEVLPATWLGR